MLRRLFLIPIRFLIALRYYINPMKRVVVWLVNSRELSNFTYALEEMNKRYLAAFVAEIAGERVEKILYYFDEIEMATEMRSYIERIVTGSEFEKVADKKIEYGRRIAWYALVRSKKPKVVVETGVEKGLGSCVIVSALMKNLGEGYPGCLLATDIDPKAGLLVKPRPYSDFVKVLYGDSIESLKQLRDEIDIFIHDSDHRREYEWGEYTVVGKLLSKNSFIISDNAHCSDALWAFAKETGRSFLSFQERPSHHWYPGVVLGVAFSRVWPS